LKQSGGGWALGGGQWPAAVSSARPVRRARLPGARDAAPPATTLGGISPPAGGFPPNVARPRGAGLPTAKPLGVVEITPEREYLIVTEFFAGAVELGRADVDDSIIDQGLLVVRKLWDAGLAHRDIKPANLLVAGGRLLLIDVAFVQVRPSPWRQAVDLGTSGRLRT